jgi:hypothetical protein
MGSESSSVERNQRGVDILNKGYFYNFTWYKITKIPINIRIMIVVHLVYNNHSPKYKGSAPLQLISDAIWMMVQG